jgi:hypothetical protein
LDDCNWDLLAIIANLDASGGDVSNKLSLGETLFTGNGAAGTATIVYPRAKGNITFISGQSEDAALVNWRFRDQANMQNWTGGTVFQGGQTEACEIDKRIARCNIPVDTGSQLVSTITNAAAKLDGIVLGIGKNGRMPKISGSPFGPLPPGAMWVEGTTAHTSTADTWVQGAVTLPDYTLDRQRRYAILGVAVHGASLMAWRLRGYTGDNAPGSIGGDTDQLNCPVFFDAPHPTFHGKDGFKLETLCSAGDTASAGMYLLLPL